LRQQADRQPAHGPARAQRGRGSGAFAAVGHGSVALAGEEPRRFVYSEVFAFTGGFVSRLDTFHIWLAKR
jgi:hypothetical protein